ncbi:fructose-1,6-bisphosphatase [Ligilactobacillus saerimneri]|uniref:fructose-1,6-bisphosphatase n=1 Tax=Ligilactobacillus saerimneri TaxID=228229 RepID=UPI0024B90AEB|nr:fructose-1,6-bisphosphatase [Ligilactobacillus saerimneri]
MEQPSINSHIDAFSARLIRQKFPTKQAVITEIMNLKAILHLPKATEHFVSDLHGEFDAFDYVLRNGSGSIKQKIHAHMDGFLTPRHIEDLAILVYYPEDEIDHQKKHLHGDVLDQWYLDVVSRLLTLLQAAASKYTRSKVRKALDPNFAYITEEFLYNDARDFNKHEYSSQLLTDMLSLHQAEPFIIATCYSIQRLVVDHLHVVGDVYDRGDQPDKIMERLIAYPSVDIQWGNHDILWLGAMAGSKLCMLTLLRICARYNNLNIVEDAYGINLRHLVAFAEQHYGENPSFCPKLVPGDSYSFTGEKEQLTRIHQAIAIMQFKLEGQTIERRPEFKMDARNLLRQIDYKQQTLAIDGKTYPLENTCFQMIDPKNPNKLTPEENEIINSLLLSFQNSTKLKRHLDFMLHKGSLYKCYNGNLLVHGCLPVTADGKWQKVVFNGHTYAGKQLLDFCQEQIETAYAHPDQTDDFATDLLWYLWEGEHSPLFGKKKMTTFERYFIKDKKTHHEEKNAYFDLRKDEKFCQNILVEFDLDPHSGHIINGHTPIKKGQSGIMAHTKMLVIDGGYSKAYHHTTGIGGCTLLYNSYGLQLVTHHPFTSKQEIIEKRHDNLSKIKTVNQVERRKKVADTDTGKALQHRIEVLRVLLNEDDAI